MKELEGRETKWVTLVNNRFKEWSRWRKAQKEEREKWVRWWEGYK